VLDSLGWDPSLAATVAYQIGEPINRTVATMFDGSTIVDFPSMAQEVRVAGAGPGGGMLHL